MIDKAGINRLKDRIRSQVKFLQLYLNPHGKKDIVNEFHKLYYASARKGLTWGNNNFLGIPIQKCPFDQMVYQEIIYNLKPDLIIETGTAYGGNALFMASICDLINKGEVVTIDIVNTGKLPDHKRISYLLGSSIDDSIIKKLKEYTKKKKTILVILDSNHTRDHVFKELELYSNFVSLNSYIIVEDSNINNNPVYPDHGPGPMEAIQDWIGKNSDFVIDKTMEKHLFSFNPNGYLQRVK